MSSTRTYNHTSMCYHNILDACCPHYLTKTTYFAFVDESERNRFVGVLRELNELGGSHYEITPYLGQGKEPYKIKIKPND